MFVCLFSFGSVNPGVVMMKRKDGKFIRPDESVTVRKLWAGRIALTERSNARWNSKAIYSSWVVFLLAGAVFGYFLESNTVLVTSQQDIMSRFVEASRKAPVIPMTTSPPPCIWRKTTRPVSYKARHSVYRADPSLFDIESLVEFYHIVSLPAQAVRQELYGISLMRNIFGKPEIHYESNPRICSQWPFLGPMEFTLLLYSTSKTSTDVILDSIHPLISPSFSSSLYPSIGYLHK
jgi:hypothetical protein